jgi:hypothetical protein
MAQIIKIKSSTTPGNAPGTLETGELAINVTDGSLFFGSATTVHSSFKFGEVTATGTIAATQYNSTSSIYGYNLNGTKVLWKEDGDIQVGNAAIVTDIIGTSINLQSPVTSSEAIDMGTNKITGLGDPTLAQDGATKAYVDSQTHTDGTVTSVAALTLGTTGTDLSSTVADGTTAAVITLNVPTASASNRGALSSTDWTTFNDKTTNTGTVTSVSSTTGGDALDVAVSNASTTPAIALTWAGADTQYIDGEGNLITFPTIPVGDVTAVDGGTYITTTDSTGPVPVVNHDATDRTDTTSTVSPAHGDTFTAVDSVSTNATGHITALNLKTVTLPDDAEGVTSVSGTAPVSVTAGATPTVSMAVATTSASGYLTSTDWTTFNNKTSNTGTVTSVGTTGTVNGITLTGGDITSSGTITLGGTLGSIANSQLTNSTVSLGGVTLSLGGTDTSPIFNLEDAHSYPGDIDLVTTGTITSGIWNSSRLFTSTSSACGNMGDYVTFGAVEGVVCSYVYYYDGSAWALANAGAVSTSTGLLAIARGNVPGKGMMLRGMFGVIPGEEAPNSGDVLYLSETDGVLTNVAPTTSEAVVRVVGYAVNDTPGIWWNPDNTWVELS